ncbi:proprotein convertase P-domain-containing protein [Novosphingobium sp.]|uniref:proprotein convertase P-domain-containing protein n=1 Tax=Novosphingobium sp. TaxID=1874826 RepID=UPI00286AEB84|nr:proprotein convertase P-domain-containing protein [Novosphingobium sp.]
MGSLGEHKPGRLLGLKRMAFALFALVGLALSASQPASAQTVTRYTNNTASATNGINNTATPCSNTLKRTFAVGTSYIVSDVNIGVLLTHTARGDLTITLVSPSGTRVVVSNQVGGTKNNFNALLDDSAGTAITAYTFNDTITAVPPYNQTLRPSNALSVFNGEQAAGTWTLELCDSVSADSGTFDQADLYLTAAATNYADLSLAQSVSSTTPNDRTTITYTLTVANAATSPQTATGVVVRDLLPSGVIFISASGAGTYNSATGDWAVGTLAPGANAALTITATVAAGDTESVANAAEITASSHIDPDSTPNNGVTSEDDYASTTFTVVVSRSAGTAPTLTCSAGTGQFDWDSQAWTAGATSGSYTVTGVGTVGFAITNPNGIFLNNATYGGQSPAKQTAVTGGLGTAQNSLEQLVDLNNQSATVDTTITLGTAVPGAQFTIFDVDFNTNQFADKVAVTGYLNGNAVTPTLTNGTANWVSGNSAYGDALSSDIQANGNVVVTFSSAIDKIVINYGNHSYAPTNPGQQGVALHDITFCKPVTSISVTKVSSVLNDPVNGTTNPKAIPGAVVEYCILVSNTGTNTLSNIAATDALPANFTFTAGTMTSGISCAAATTAEDDNNTGTDESDPFGAAISGTSLTASAASLSASSGFALKFRGTIN